jgi:hypothetical protein
MKKVRFVTRTPDSFWMLFVRSACHKPRLARVGVTSTYETDRGTMTYLMPDITIERDSGCHSYTYYTRTVAGLKTSWTKVRMHNEI